MRKCINCVWQGEDTIHKNHKYCPVCGDNTENIGVKEIIPKKKEKLNMDLNNDGKIDKEDSRIASKVMNAFKNKNKRSKQGKKR